MAVNCWVPLSAMLGLDGDTAMEVSATGLTVNVVLALICPPPCSEQVAEIVVVPWATLVANPDEETLATVVTEEVHADEFVRFWVELSL